MQLQKKDKTLQKWTASEWLNHRTGKQRKQTSHIFKSNKCIICLHLKQFEFSLLNTALCLFYSDLRCVAVRVFQVLCLQSALQARWMRQALPLPQRSLQLVTRIWTGLWSLLYDVAYSQLWWPILGIRALHLPIQVHTHSSEHTHTHTHYEHTPGAVGSHLCCGARGAVGDAVPRQGIEGGEGAVHSLPPPTIPAGPRLELTTFRLRVRISNH